MLIFVYFSIVFKLMFINYRECLGQMRINRIILLFMVDMKHIEFLENRVVISVDNNNNDQYLKVMEILLNDEN